MSISCRTAIAALAFALASCSLALAQLAPDQATIAAVAAGTLKEAKASAWGFDPEDSTAQLQAAIDSGVPKLTVDKMAGPWIVMPLTLVSNQEITFEEGVELLARRGEYHDSNATLMTASNAENIILSGYGATFRMWREDYDNAELYTHAEWRHALSIRSSSNIKVLGLTFADSGGDGIYLGTATPGVTNKNVEIRDVTCIRNYRQGISVITAEDLLIENTVMRDTAGTPPMAGIDFEPNNPGERLVNCVMRNCLTENNRTYGYVLAISPLNATSEPISMRFENCRSVNDGGMGFTYAAGGSIETAVGGMVEFVDCSVEGSVGAGIAVIKPARQGFVRFVDCSLVNTGQKDIAPIVFRSGRDTDDACGGAEFVNLRVTDTRLDKPMAYLDYGGVAIDRVSGDLVLIDPQGEETRVTLTPEILARWMPQINLRDIPRLGLEGLALQPLATQPEDATPVWPWQRRVGQYLVYAAAGDQVSFRGDLAQVGTYAGVEMPVTITAPSGEVVHRASVPFQGEATVGFTAPETGVYTVIADGGGNKMRLSDWSHPMALTGGGKELRFMQFAGELQFYVPEGTTTFGVRVWGEGVGEGVQATLINPVGEVVGSVDDQVQTYQFEIELEEPSPGAVWTLRTARPGHTTWEDFYVDLRGIPPLLTPRGAALLAPAGN